MLKSLKIENFRGFESFELEKLGRINLLVGENNSGKTSVLEALLLLMSRLDFAPTGQMMLLRGEIIAEKRDNGEVLDVRHLFHGRDLDSEQQIVLSGKYSDFVEKLALRIDELEWVESQAARFDFWRVINLEWSAQSSTPSNPPTSQKRVMPLQEHGGLELKVAKPPRIEADYPLINLQFIPIGSVSVITLLQLFENIQLTPQEELINQALRTIEPRCERIAGKTTHNRFEVKLSDQEQPIPLGSMGDGMSRILRLALGLANAKGGVLLIDEIDTGLHFSAMLDMWKMIWETAAKLDIQVFATTHSRDCWESLAEVADLANVGADEILLHRIEAGKSSSIIFDAQQIAIAVEERLEVR